jgi:hypothetical protein
MDWKLDNLTDEQERAVDHYGYVGAFWSVLMPRLLANELPKTEPVTPQPDIDLRANTYIPLARRE